MKLVETVGNKEDITAATSIVVSSPTLHPRFTSLISNACAANATYLKDQVESLTLDKAHLQREVKELKLENAKLVESTIYLQQAIKSLEGRNSNPQPETEELKTESTDFPQQKVRLEIPFAHEGIATDQSTSVRIHLMLCNHPANALPGESPQAQAPQSRGR